MLWLAVTVVAAAMLGARTASASTPFGKASAWNDQLVGFVQSAAPEFMYVRTSLGAPDPT